MEFLRDKNIGKFNKDWDHVYNYFSRIFYFINDKKVKIKECSNKKFIIEIRGKTIEFPVINNVINFCQDKSEKKIYQEMQHGEIGFWEKGGVRNRKESGRLFQISISS